MSKICVSITDRAKALAYWLKLKGKDSHTSFVRGYIVYPDMAPILLKTAKDWESCDG